MSASRRPLPLPHDRAVGAASALPGVADTVAAQWAELGVVHRLGPHTLPIIHWTDPFTQEEDAYLPALAPAAVADARLWADLPLSLADRVDRLVARVDPGGTPPSGWTRFATYMEPRGPSRPPRSDVRVRAAGKDDHSFVLGCLARSILGGYEQRGYRLDPKRTRATVEELFGRQLRESTVRSLVAVREDEPVGHITWEPDVPDDCGAEPHTEIVDTMTLPGASGLGVSATLVAALRERTREDEATLRGQVLWPIDGRTPEPLEALRQAGWQEIFELWSRPTDRDS